MCVLQLRLEVVVVHKLHVYTCTITHNKYAHKYKYMALHAHTTL